MTLTNLTELDICNDALILVKSGAVGSVTDPTTTKETTCARMYDLTMNDLFSRHDWSFVNRTIQLQVDADKAAAFGYTYAYKLPSDLVAGPFAVFADNYLQEPAFDYKVQDDYVHTNYTQVDILYRVAPDPSIWPGYFRSLATKALAANLAQPISGKTTLQEELRIEAFGDAQGTGTGGIFKAAKRLDSQTKPIKSIFQNGDPLSTARLSGIAGGDHLDYLRLP